MVIIIFLRVKGYKGLAFNKMTKLPALIVNMHVGIREYFSHNTETELFHKFLLIIYLKLTIIFLVTGQAGRDG